MNMRLRAASFGRIMIVFAFLVWVELILPAAGRAPAQNADLLLLDYCGMPRLLGAPRTGGNATTLHNLMFHARYDAMELGPGDDSVYLQGLAFQTTLSFLVQANPTSVTTLAIYGTSWQWAGDARMDDAGDLEFLWFGDSRGDGIYSAPVGSPVLTKLVSFPTGIAYPLAFTEDRSTGGWYVLGGSGSLYQVGRDGVVRSIASLLLLLENQFDLTDDPTTGDLLYPFGGVLFRYNLQNRTLQTVYHNIALNARWHDITFDPRTRGYWVAGESFGPAVDGIVLLVSDKGVAISVSKPASPAAFMRIRPTFGRVFTPINAPARGSTYWILLRLQWEPGASYQAALAFDYRPGIATATGTIPIGMDPLFFLSMAGAPLFRKFQGTLDGKGGSLLGIDIPAEPVLQRTRLHLAAVTYDASGIRSILGPHSFTIR